MCQAVQWTVKASSVRWVVWSAEEHTSAGAAARWSRVPVAKAKGLLCAAVLLAAGVFHSFLHPPFHPFSLSSDITCSSSPTLQPRAPWLSLDSFLFLSLALSRLLDFPSFFFFTTSLSYFTQHFSREEPNSLFLLKFSEHRAEFRDVLIEYLDYKCDDEAFLFSRSDRNVFWWLSLSSTCGKRTAPYSALPHLCEH